jgi:hypothetical protein
VEEMNLKIKTYLRLLKNEVSLESALTTLKTVETYGLGFGQMDKKDTYQDRKKLT